MKVYLAGPMRGRPFFNFPAFFAAAAKLRADGHEVFNPAEYDNEKAGTDISTGNESGDEDMAAARFGYDRRKSLEADLAWICREADAIALLPGWGESLGALAEYWAARACDLEIITL